MSTESTSPTSKIRRGPWKTLLITLLILAGIVALLRSLCSTLDITDDPARNGGFDRGKVLVLQQPIVVIHGDQAEPAPDPPPPGERLIPAGTRLQIVEVHYIRTFVPDNMSRAQPLARWLDGPLTGQPVYLQDISQRSRDRTTTTIDPAFLAPNPPATTSPPRP